MLNVITLESIRASVFTNSPLPEPNLTIFYTIPPKPTGKERWMLIVIFYKTNHYFRTWKN